MKTPFYATTAMHSARSPVWLSLLLSIALVGCSTKPPVPDWQLQSHAALQRATNAYLQGQDRVATVELDFARKQLSSTGRADLVANAELVHCAARAASLVWDECLGFTPLRPDATPAQQAYADYLRGQMAASDAALLPPAQRTVAQASTAEAAAQAVAALEEPLSKLLAAATALKSGKTSPALVAQAVDVASHQGWRRPLLAWLRVQALQAEQSGATQDAAEVRRRIDLVQGTGTR